MKAFEVYKWGRWWWAIKSNHSGLLIKEATSQKLILFRTKKEAQEHCDKLNKYGDEIYDQ